MNVCELAAIAVDPRSVSSEVLERLLRLENPADVAELRNAAYEVKSRAVGRTVYLRGLIEFSNICSKNCRYCGIRRGNRKVERYEMDEDEIAAAALSAYGQGFGSVILQSGERQDGRFIDGVERAVARIKRESRRELGITLSAGEQTAETYERWFRAGAHRYLLRIETSCPDLYRALHPADHLFETRRECLRSLKSVGYQVGTGVMIGLPGQTAADLARDVLFFRDIDVDMIGMGPYVLHRNTPLARYAAGIDPARTLLTALKMLAVTRLVLPDINLASTTALRTLKPDGYELGVLAGANVVMPNITPARYRDAYRLYEGKPGIDGDAGEALEQLTARMASIGETVGLGQWGDAPHFARRTAVKKGAA